MGRWRVPLLQEHVQLGRTWDEEANETYDTVEWDIKIGSKDV